jgi:hypothetical protein
MTFLKLLEQASEPNWGACCSYQPGQRMKILKALGLTLLVALVSYGLFALIAFTVYLGLLIITGGESN